MPTGLRGTATTFPCPICQDEVITFVILVREQVTFGARHHPAQAQDDGAFTYICTLDARMIWAHIEREHPEIFQSVPADRLPRIVPIQDDREHYVEEGEGA